MIKKIYIAVLILIIAVIVFYWLRPHSKFLLTLLPPSNLYRTVARQPITLKEENTSQHLSLTHKYSGTYLVGAYIQKPPPFGSSIESNASLSFSVKNNERLLLKKKFTNWTSRFGGPEKKQSGVILGYYKVPDDIPVGVATQATFSVDTPDCSFEKKYGKLELFIRRKSDQ